MKYTGARILIESLIEQGVDTIFGYPGGTVLFIYDELYKQKDRIRHILVSHEQHASHAADGYARATGKAGVCLATSGPGATNLVTGIATAYMDSIPLVAITGNVSTPLLGKDSFQEVDIAGITMPIVKHNWIVRDINDLAEIVREAFVVARSGRPGPVLIDIPKDITSETTEYAPGSTLGVQAFLERPASVLGGRALRLAERNARQTWTDADINRALGLMQSAKRPLLFAGGGVIISGANDELKTFAERLGAPVALSLMGIGAMPANHPLCTGMIGMHGTVASNKAVQAADLLIVVGTRFSDRVTSRADRFANEAKILHIDIDPAEINKNIPSYDCIIGDIKNILTAMIQKIPPREAGLPSVTPAAGWGKDIALWKREKPEANFRKTALHPRFIIEETAKALDNKFPENDAVVVTDVGQHQMWAAQFYPINKPRHFITSGGLGTMGYGLGAAMGAAVAVATVGRPVGAGRALPLQPPLQPTQPSTPVVLFTGDGSFRMNCGELATLANYHLPVLIIVINNGVLGMVRQWQNLFYEERYSETTLDRPPDFVKLADAYSIKSFNATDEASFKAALEGAIGEISNGKPALINAQIDKDEMVLPMVPGGKPIDEMIT
ncbi:MAG: biosynthetic-type acetolactate synthase large subunit [Spirochaetaceae bacterium]|jgi:acetolactate synthase-1/2/3 large subunit|nr:biosynthetic-type acetolactate synthase large subunit [Spirochaetaceae bacterium]